MVKLIKHTGECDHPDDETLPAKLEMYLRSPEFMAVAFACLYGGSEVVIARSETVLELETWMKDRGLAAHPRLSRFRLSLNAEVIKSHNWS
jgi:hypothetical protein